MRTAFVFVIAGVFFASCSDQHILTTDGSVGPSEDLVDEPTAAESPAHEHLAQHHAEQPVIPHGGPPSRDSETGDSPNEVELEDLANADAATIFSRRILPILKSDAASSCTECHLAGVE